MGFNRPEAKRLAKAAMRNTNPNPMLVTLVFVLLTTGVSYLVGLVLTNPIYDALYTAYLYLLDGAYDPMFIFKSLLSPGMVAVYMLVSLLLNVYFWVMNFGYASYALRMARGEQPGYRRLFDGFAALGRAILVSLLTSIFLSLWGLLFMVPYMVVMILAALLGSMGLMMLAILPPGHLFSAGSPRDGRIGIHHSEQAGDEGVEGGAVHFRLVLFRLAPPGGVGGAGGDRPGHAVQPRSGHIAGYGGCGGVQPVAQPLHERHGGQLLRLGDPWLPLLPGEQRPRRLPEPLRQQHSGTIIKSSLGV